MRSKQSGHAAYFFIIALSRATSLIIASRARCAHAPSQADWQQHRRS